MRTMDSPLAGDWFTAGGAQATFLGPEAEERLMPVDIAEDMTLSELGIDVASPGDAGAVIRLGVRGINPLTRRPSGLLIDAGTVSGSVGGPQTIAGLSIPAPRGLIYLSATVQGGVATKPTLRGLVQVPFTIVKADMTNTSVVTWFATGVSGALPTVAPTLRSNAVMPRVWARRA
jgi:hypothetical protein